jgi:hypothetical protein
MMIYAGAGQLKKMPNIGEDINWIPVDVCSAALVDLALKSSFDISTSMHDRVYHLLNPHAITYTSYLNCLRVAGLEFDIVSPKEFVDTILSAKDTNNSLIKLSSFFERMYTKRSMIHLSKFAIMKTVQTCEILRNCPSIDSNLIQLYLDYWRRIDAIK